jgi:hypothetical protein
MSFQTNLNVNPYYDDYKEHSAENPEYYQVLFRPGYAIQARELTTLQTILSKQIERFGKHMFQEGSLVIPGNVSYNQKLDYITMDASLLEKGDQLIEIGIGDVEAVVISIDDNDYTNTGNADIVYLKYTKTGTNELKTFIPGSNNLTFTPEGGATVTRDIFSVGNNSKSAVGVVDGVYFIRGHFVKCSEHLLIIDQNFDGTVGFNVIETLVTPESAIQGSEITDNATGSSNFGAKGAHRLSIELSLAVKLPTDTTENFIELITLKNGILQTKISESKYSFLGDALAKRTYDESGNYTVDEFTVEAREHLDNGSNSGTYLATDGGDKDKAVIKIGPGKAYIEGYKLTKNSPTTIAVDKSIQNTIVDNVSVHGGAGNYLEVRDLNLTDASIPSLDQLGGVRLWNRDINASFGADPDVRFSTTLPQIIGVARLKGVDGTAGDRTKVYLTDIQMNTSIDIICDNDVATFHLLNNQRVLGKRSGAFGYLWTTDTNWASVAILKVIDVSGEFLLNEEIEFSNYDRISTASPAEFSGLTIQPQNAKIVKITKEDPTSIKMIQFGWTGTTATADVAMDDEKVLTGTFGIKYGADGNGTAPSSGTVSNDAVWIGGNGTKFLTELRPLDIINIRGTGVIVRDIISDTKLLLGEESTHTYPSQYANFASGEMDSGTRVRAKFYNTGDESLIYKLPKSNITNTAANYSATTKTFIDSNAATTGSVTFSTAGTGQVIQNYDWDTSNFTLFKKTSLDGLGNAISPTWYTVNMSADLWGNPTVTSSGVTFNHSTIASGDLFKLHIAGQETTSNLRNDLVENFNTKLHVGVAPASTLTSAPIYGRDYRNDKIALMDGSSQYNRVIKIKAIYDYADSLSVSDIEPKITLSANTSVLSGDIISCSLSGAIGSITGNVTGGTVINYHRQKGTFKANDEITILSISTGVLTTHTISSVVLSTDGSNVIDVTDSYVLDTGQRSSLIGVSSIVRRKSAPIPADDRKLLVIFDHFSGSYSQGPITAYTYQYTSSTVNPTFTKSTVSQGREPVDAYLTDCIDFRPTLISSYDGNPFNTLSRLPHSSTFSLPEPNTPIKLGSLNYNLPRIDSLYLNRYGEFKVMKGVSSESTIAPPVIKGSMKIADIYYPPETNSTTYKDIQISKVANQRYTMSDIRKLDNRIDTLEYYVSLNQLEANAANMDIRDQFGFDRFKSGFVVDNFRGHSVGDTIHPDYSCAIDKKNNTLRPKGNIESANLTISGLVPSGLKMTGDILSLHYETSTLISQGIGTQSINVNPFNIISWVGDMKLSPETDTWIDSITSPEIILERDGNYETLKSENNIGTIWESWKELWVGEETLDSKTAWWSRRWSEVNPDNGWMMSGHHVKSIFSTTTRMAKEGVKTELIESFEKKLVGTKVINSSIIPYMRKNDIKVDIVGMKGNTKFYPFFDGISVIDSMSKKQTTDPTSPPLIPITPATEDTELKTDPKGSWSGYFTVPNGAKKFTTGKKILRFTDSSTNAYDASVETAAESPYEASGTLNTEESTFLSIRNGEIVKSTVNEEKDVISLRESEIVDAYRDPLAQTFEVKKDGGTFLTSIDLFFDTKDNMGLPVTVMIRSVDNGYPAKIILPFSKVSLDPSDVNVSKFGETPTTFTFDGPVYLKDKGEYCIVIESASNKYTCFVSEIGEKDLISTSVVTDQPHLGSFFMSQNSSTWTAEQMMDLKFTLKCADFQTTTEDTITLKSDLLKLESEKASSTDLEELVKLGDNPLRLITRSISPVIRVYHPNHGYTIGDQVTVSGVSLSSINATYPVNKIETDYYSIIGSGITLADLPLESSNFGGSDITVGKRLPCDIIHPIVSVLDFDETNITTRLSSLEVQLNSDIVLDSRKYISYNGSSNPELLVSMSTSNSNISPILDTARMGLLAISNRVNSISEADDIVDTLNYRDSKSSEGDSNSSVYLTKQINLNNPAESISVFIDASIPTFDAGIEVYYKTQISTSGQTQFDDLNWVPFNVNGSSDSGLPSGGGFDFIEYEYSVGDLNLFNTFAIKIVMKSSNPSRPPLIKNFRAIALA